MAIELFSKNLTQRHQGTKEDKIFLILSSFVPLCLCVKKFGLIVALLFLPIHFMQAQEEGSRSVQRLSWTGDENTRRYEIVIEKEEADSYRELLRESTTALYIDVSLSPGKYRCLVITYDFLNQPGGGSEWMYIEVLAHPEADGLLPDFFVLDTDTGLPADKTGDAHVDIFFSAAWMPSFTIYDKENRFNGRNRSLAGVTGSFGVLWDKPYYFNPGLELAASYSFFNADGGQTHLLTFALNLLLQKWLPGETMALTFRLGAGYNLLLPYDYGAFQTNMGISFLLFVTDHLYLEAGLGYAYWFSTPPANIFRPWLGTGWRF
jgi:hypothetical protein